MVEPLDPHAELGVRPDATQPEIREAFRRRLREHHPDIRRTSGPAAAEESDHALQRVLAAYAALRGAPDADQPTPAPADPDPAVRVRAAARNGRRPALWAAPVRWDPAAETQRVRGNGGLTWGSRPAAVLLGWLLGDPRRD